MTCHLADDALASAPDYPAPGRWTPFLYTASERGAAATALATAIRSAAYMLTTEERARFAIEILTPHSSDHTELGEPA